MRFGERAVLFECEGERLVGVLTEPRQPATLGVVIVAGAPQYRVGAHRQFVSLARALGAAGIAVLRFDYRGTGDATGVPRSFQEIDSDIASAIDTIAAHTLVHRIVLLGLCDGASAALLYCRSRRDARVVGMALFNPWIRSEESLAAAHLRGYYPARIFEADFWRNLVRGRIHLASAIRSFLANLGAFARARAEAEMPDWQIAMMESLDSFAGPVMILLSGRDLTAREFSARLRRNRRWRHSRHGNVVIRELAGADHTFSTWVFKREVQRFTLEWLESHVIAGTQ